MTRQSRDHRPEGVIDLLKEILAGAPAMPDAACRTTPMLFGPRERDEGHATVARRHEAAVRVCRFTCPEFAKCRVWVDSLPGPQRPSGVVAGLMPGGGAARETAHGGATAGGVALSHTEPDSTFGPCELGEGVPA